MRFLKLLQKEFVMVEPGSYFFPSLFMKLLKQGLIPKLVPELKGITRGAVSSCSVESMSFKYGGFHDSCLEYEVISASGEIITCSPENHPEIFHMIHGSRNFGNFNETQIRTYSG